MEYGIWNTEQNADENGHPAPPHPAPAHHTVQRRLLLLDE
jgi:hypothetical protein